MATRSCALTPRALSALTSVPRVAAPGTSTTWPAPWATWTWDCWVVVVWPPLRGGGWLTWLVVVITTLMEPCATAAGRRRTSPPAMSVPVRSSITTRAGMWAWTRRRMTRPTQSARSLRSPGGGDDGHGHGVQSAGRPQTVLGHRAGHGGGRLVVRAPEHEPHLSLLVHPEGVRHGDHHLARRRRDRGGGDVDLDLGPRRPGRSTPDDEGALGDGVDLPVEPPERRLEEHAARERLSVAEGRDRHGKPHPAGGEGREVARHHHGGDVPDLGGLQRPRGEPDPKLPEHVGDGLGRVHGLARVPGARKTRHEAVAHERVLVDPVHRGEAPDLDRRHVCGPRGPREEHQRPQGGEQARPPPRRLHDPSPPLR